MLTELSALKANIFTDSDLAAALVTDRPREYAESQQNFE
jgi:hypothetical protein